MGNKFSAVSLLTKLESIFLLSFWNSFWLLCAADSGVTNRVCDTQGGNWGCHPSIFSSKTWRPFLLIAVTITIAFYCFHSGVTLLEGITPHLFCLSDLVSPLFLVNVPTTIFPSGVFSWRVSPGAVRPPPLTPLAADAVQTKKYMKYFCC